MTVLARQQPVDLVDLVVANAVLFKNLIESTPLLRNNSGILSWSTEFSALVLVQRISRFKYCHYYIRDKAIFAAIMASRRILIAGFQWVPQTQYFRGFSSWTVGPRKSLDQDTRLKGYRHLPQLREALQRELKIGDEQKASREAA